jgi:hypothetical protein
VFAFTEDDRGTKVEDGMKEEAWMLTETDEEGRVAGDAVGRRVESEAEGGKSI